MDALSFPILPISSQMGPRRNSHSSHTPYKGVGNGKRGGLGTGSTDELASRMPRPAIKVDGASLIALGGSTLLPPNRIVQPDHMTGAGEQAPRTPLPPQPSNHPSAASTVALHRLAATAPCRHAYPQVPGLSRESPGVIESNRDSRQSTGMCAWPAILEGSKP